MALIPIVVVSGLPASGKSIAANRLQTQLQWPLFAKDAYKELLFDMLGASDAAWSKKLSAAAYALLFAQARQCVRLKQSCLLEGNFRWSELADEFQTLLDATVIPVQLFVHAQPEVLVRRFQARAHTRHPGHADMESLPSIAAELRHANSQPLPLDGPVIECDTTDDWNEAIDAAIAKVLFTIRAL